MAASATEYQVRMAAFIQGGQLAWMSNEALVAAVQAQNATTASLTEAEIIALDDTWRAQVGTAGTTLVDSVLANATADFLRRQVEASFGVITEIIVMNAAGLNVAVSHVTSDYWQGDEAKHQDPFGIGPDAVHFSEIELDESSQRCQGQISVALADPARGAAIGAVTIGVDAQALS